MIATEPTHAPGIDPYLKSFERFEQQGAAKHPSWLFPMRKAGISRFAELGFPTVKDEDWRFTNVAPLVRLPFKPISDYVPAGLDKDWLGRLSFSGLKGSRLVFVNGHFSAEHSSIAAQHTGKVTVSSLAAALATDSGLIEKHLGHYVRGGRNAFSALNTAFFEDGLFVHVPPGQALNEPVQVVYVATVREPGAASHPRGLIIVEEASQLTLIESHVSVVDGPYMTNAVTELVVGRGAVVEHCKFQDESPEAFHIATLCAQLEGSSNFVHHSIAAGARLSRNNIFTKLDGEGIDCVLNGLYLTSGERLADHYMIVEHAKPHCNSHEYFNGILDGRSKGVFHGRILVRQEAQKTDAKQTNKNLLLSEDATADTKPQLEIYADDVKCTHGATVGQLNEEAVFYLRTRGIPEETARRMLIHAFAGEIIDRVRFEPVREELDKLVWDRLEENEQIKVQ